VRIEDAVPLFHTPVLAPSLEVACMLVDEHCKAMSAKSGTGTAGESRPWRIVGVYAADDKLTCSTPSAVVERLASQIAAKSKGAKCCLLMVDNQALASESKPSFVAYVPSGIEWKAATPKAFDIEASCNSLFSQRLKGAKTVYDFDDHFSNVLNDWRNLDFAA